MTDLADVAQRYVDRRPWLPGSGRSLARVRALDPPTDEALCRDIADAYAAAPAVSGDPAVPETAVLDLGTERLDSALKDAPESRAEVMKTLSDMYY